MNLTDDEKRLLKNYRYMKTECQAFQPSSISVPACAFGAPKGTYILTMNAEFVKEE